ncbi:MAG: hypothetical protein EU536_02470 [Promethearchaeota archaeon]|nr:MAG: hypothetical protein EU536_02470 [Candidatus Lokiarchaeota archaeon]
MECDRVNTGEDKTKSLLQEFQNIEETFRLVQDSITNIKTMIESVMMQKTEPKKKLVNIGVTDLLELPEELRKSVIAVMKSGTGQIQDIIARTKREEQLEKGYLEALVAMEYLKKETSAKHNVPIYRLGLGKRKSKVSDDIWKVLVKDSAEMVSFICRMEIEKAQLKIYDIDEMLSMAPQAETDLEKIKVEINRYISALQEISENY